MTVLLCVVAFICVHIQVFCGVDPPVPRQIIFGMLPPNCQAYHLCFAPTSLYQQPESVLLLPMCPCPMDCYCPPRCSPTPSPLSAADALPTMPIRPLPPNRPLTGPALPHQVPPHNVSYGVRTVCAVEGMGGGGIIIIHCTSCAHPVCHATHIKHSCVLGAYVPYQCDCFIIFVHHHSVGAQAQPVAKCTTCIGAHTYVLK